MRRLAVLLAILILAALASNSGWGQAQAAIATEHATYGYGMTAWNGHGPEWWHWQYVKVRQHLRDHWRPTVFYAYRLASVVYGVPESQLRAVAWCESRHSPRAVNGRYRGLFQEGPMFEAGPFARFGVFDPIANTLTAARIVAREGWRQWECRP